ncbi:TetR/AcrR family transcriptional regulator [Hoeflea sp. AS60]|uniref:TetR/AcrR family transcriptional regulator n=1 Tax=Hoeflea sp. AS60 TaxID=3135780 RepID=UPI00317742BA
MTQHAPRKQARQTRSIATQTAIIEAAAHILEQHGAAALTTNAAAERAGVSIGSLYQYFPNKQSIIASLLRREWASMLDQIRTVSQSDLPPDEKLHRLIAIAIDHQFARPRLALELEYVESSLELSEEMQHLASSIAGEVRSVVRSFDPDASPVIAADVVSICRVLTNDAAMRGETDTQAVTRRVTRAVLGFLTYRE